MDRQDYQAWLTEIDDLSPAQRLDTARLLAGQPSLEAVIGLLEERIGAERGCPHCAAAGAVTVDAFASETTEKIVPLTTAATNGVCTETAMSLWSLVVAVSLRRIALDRA